METIPFSTLSGLVLEKFEKIKTWDQGDYDKIVIHASGRKFVMYHESDCCESVTVESITGNVEKAIGETIIDATENSNKDEPKIEGTDDSWTWTYYTIRTQSETIVIRWYGSSNGYYSESVDFCEMTD
jgi:hypothetical protein